MKNTRKSSRKSAAIQAVEAVCDLDAKLSEEEAEMRRAEALAALEQLDVKEPRLSRFVELIDEILRAQAGCRMMCSGQVDVIRRSAEGEPGFNQYFASQRRSADALRAMACTLESPLLPRSDGFTASALMDRAVIGKDLWQRIRTAAGIEGRRGESARRFDTSDIEKLLEAAERLGTTKSRSAADAWRELCSRE